MAFVSSTLSLPPVPGISTLTPAAWMAPVAGTPLNWNGRGGAAFPGPPGSGAGGGSSSIPPREGPKGDEEDRISHNYSVSNTDVPGLSGTQNGRHFIKFLPVWCLRQPALRVQKIASSVNFILPVHCINLLLSKYFDAGMTELITLAKGFESQFPDVFYDLTRIRNDGGGGGSGSSGGAVDVNTSVITFVRFLSREFDNPISLFVDPATDVKFWPNGSSYPSESSGNHRELLADIESAKSFMDAKNGKLYPDTSISTYNSKSASVKAFTQQQEQAIEQRNAEIERILQNADLSNTSSVFSTGSNFKTSRLNSADQESQFHNTLRVRSAAIGTGGVGTNASYYTKKTITSSAITDSTQYLELLVRDEEQRLFRKRTVLSKLASVIRATKLSTLTKNESFKMAYLFLQGFRDAWNYLGILNTISDDSQRKHQHGIPTVTYPLLKVDLEGVGISKNFWGSRLHQNDSVYFVATRSMKTNKIAEVLAKLGSTSIYDLGLTDLDLCRIAVEDYGALVVQAVVVEAGQPKPIDDYRYCHVNLFGQIELGQWDYVGTVRDYTNVTHYDNNLRDAAMGLSNIRDGITTQESALNACKMLPNVDIVFQH